MRRLPLILLSLLIAAAVITGAAYYRYTHPLAVHVAATAPATMQTTGPATVAVKTKKERGPATQLLDIVRVNDPKYPTTQRLDSALDLRYSARIVLSDPVYLDTQGNLWITRADAPEKFNFLKASASETATHVVRDEVVFVLWTSGDNGKWLPHLVVRDKSGTGYQLVDYDGRRRLADAYGFDWERALVLPGRGNEAPHLIVPTASGVCAFTFDQNSDAITMSHHQLIDPKSKEARDRAVQLVMDVGGVIAYVTNAAGTHGEKGVARFAPVSANGAEYKWTTLIGWPEHLLHLVPLLDGSVLQIVSDDAEEKDKVRFSLNSVAPVAVDRKKIIQLVLQLSAGDPDKRDEAFKQLTTYGPGISPLLEKQLEFQPVEAQIRIRQLLKNKVEPSLGSMSLNDGKMRVVNRLPDGGIIFFAEQGVAIPRPDDDTPTYISPAWLCIRPGRAVELLPPALVMDLKPDRQKIIAWGLNDYVVLDPVMGPQWYIGNRLEPMLRKGQRQFTQFAGIDNSGRWIFRDPVTKGARTATTTATTRAATSQLVEGSKSLDITDEVVSAATSRHASTTATRAVASTTQPSHAASEPSLAKDERSTLIIDPHLPDPTPRLPGWQLPVSAGKAGWDKNDWPVIYMDVKPNHVPWALEESDWRVIDEKKEKVYTDPAEVPKSAATTVPATIWQVAKLTPTTSKTAASTQHLPATTTASTQEVAPIVTGELVLVTGDGTRYYDGQQTLKVLKPDGTFVSWLLPASAVGSGKVTLLENKEKLLFLFNSPGRIVRIRPTPEEDEPFRVDGVFTRSVPTEADPQRIWLDPADRICIAHGNNITIFFTIGRIPPAIAEKMRPEDFPPEE